MQNIFTIQKLRYGLLTVVLLELFLGGTGRLIEFTTFLTLRMCLFLVYMGLTATYLLTNKKIATEIVIIIGVLVLTEVFAAIIGFSNGASFADVFEDIKPLLSIFLLCYLGYTLRQASDIRFVLNLLKLSAILLAVFHIILYFIYLKFGSITSLYATLSSDDGISLFVFRGENGLIYYFGDLFLCIGFIVWEQYHRKSVVKYAALFLITLGILHTGTRGFIICLALVYFVKWLFLKFNLKSLLYLFIGGLILSGVFFVVKSSIGDKDESDRIRYEQLSEVGQRVTPLSAFIGHGYGVGVPVRPIHMEISFLEIFHKQGVIGLGYYLMLLLLSYLCFKRCTIKNGAGFYMTILFVFFVSNTNPYVNHPLGITVIAIAVSSMLLIAKLEANGYAVDLF